MTGDYITSPQPENENRTAGKIAFVTGGTGLLGSCVIQQLLNTGRQVKALYRSEIPVISKGDEIEWVKGDILDVIVLDEAMDNVAEVYHCAAVVSFTQKTKYQLFQTNIEGTANVVNAALNAGVDKLCFVSSVAALGRTKNGEVIDERMVWSEETNNSNYGKSKYLAEVEVWRGIAEGLQAVIVNPAIILGAGNWAEGSTKIFKSAYEEFPWYTEGSTGFVDMQDVAKAMIQLMDSDISGEKFILSADNRQYKEIFTLAAHAFGKKAPHKKVTRFIAFAVRILGSFKSIFTGEAPLVTRETAESAQTVATYDNSKLKRFLPLFSYTPIDQTVQRVCEELKEKNQLK